MPEKPGMPEKPEMPEDKPLRLVCDECEYEGDFAEFVRDSPDDTRCPKCGADVQTFIL